VTDNDLPEECFEEHRGWKLSILGIIQWLSEQIPIRTLFETDAMYYYENGIYKAHGDKKIEERLEAQFGSLTHNGKLVLEGCGKILKKIRHRTYIASTEFDNDKDIVNMKNGLYNWRTGEFKPHTPDYPCLIQIPVNYDPEADCPNIKKSFDAVFYEKDLEKFLEFIAYCLYNGYPIQKAFLLYSPGENGKSFVMNIVRQFLGPDNCAEVGLQQFGSNRFTTADLYGKLMNSCGDLDATAMKKTGDFKKIISGYDPIRAEEKGKDDFRFINRAKMIFGTNIIPNVPDTTDGFFRRLEVLLTTKMQKGDKERLHLPNDAQVLTPEEMSGLFNWVIPKLAPLIKRGKFTKQMDLVETREMYKTASDPISMFIENELEETPQCKIDKKEVYNRFLKYCKEHNVFLDIKNQEFWRQAHKLVPDMKTDGGWINVEGKKKHVQCLYNYKWASIDDVEFTNDGAKPHKYKYL